jgi:hypothetical protein
MMEVYPNPVTGVSRRELLDFALQLRGPFGFIVRAGLAPVPSCSLAAVRGVLVLFKVFRCWAGLYDGGGICQW